jgi:hypothetical protein
MSSSQLEPVRRPTKAEKIATYRTQTFLQMRPPLDYSYQELKTMGELPEHETNDGGSKARVVKEEKKETHARSGNEEGRTMTPMELAMAMLASEDASSGGADAQEKKKEDEQDKEKDAASHKKLMKTTGIRLSYNELTSLAGFEAALEAVMDNPKENLQWLDLSHNRLTSVERVLLKFPNLSVIYLHGNNIRTLKSVYQLNGLPNLRKLTLHGNPSFFPSFDSQPEPSVTEKKKITTLEDTKDYKLKLIYHLRDTQLAAVDFVPLSMKDRETAYIKRKTLRKG